jgi:hypothetical protein
MPSTVSDSTGYVYYGAAGLTKYRRREDLPLFREIGLWGVKYGMDRPTEAARMHFATCPTKKIFW